MAACLWNVGSRSILGMMEALRLPFNEELERLVDHRDKDRMAQAYTRCQVEYLRKRRATKNSKKRRKAAMRKSGIDYEAGQFE